MIYKVPTDLESIFPNYLTNLNNNLVLMLKDFNEKNYLNVKKIAHNIAGTAESYGLKRIGSYAFMIENALKQEKVQEIEHLLNLMITEIETSSFEYSDEE
tara:strand:+ start:511 stop:810 length:300 start_codon:yes stop_codon:yes gene_type:complete